jgi:hypothetical protein
MCLPMHKIPTDWWICSQRDCSWAIFLRHVQLGHFEECTAGPFWSCLLGNKILGPYMLRRGRDQSWLDLEIGVMPLAARATLPPRPSPTTRTTASATAFTNPIIFELTLHRKQSCHVFNNTLYLLPLCNESSFQHTFREKSLRLGCSRKVWNVF